MLQENPELSSELKKVDLSDLPDRIENSIYTFIDEVQKGSARWQQEFLLKKVLNILGPLIPELLGVGSAGPPQAQTIQIGMELKKLERMIFLETINYGVREFGMTGIMNGCLLGMVVYKSLRGNFFNILRLC